MLKYVEIDFCVGKVKCKLVNLNTDNDVYDEEKRYYQHRHQGFELHYAENGFYRVSNSENSFNIYNGQLLMVSPKTYHQIIPGTGKSSKISLLVEIMPPETDECDMNDIKFYQGFQRDDFVVLDIGNTEIKDNLVSIRNKAEGEMHYLKREKIRTLITILLINIFEQFFIEKNTKMNVKDSKLRSDEEILDDFFAFYFMSNSSNHDLADRLHVSTRQLHRIIKKSYNMNYREKLKEVRLEIAMNFLTNTNKSITEISNILGYSSGANFCAFIKSVMGKTPTQIRKERKEL